MPRLLRLLLLPFLILAGLVRAQSVRWEPASGTLARDQVSQLALVFEDAEPKSPPSPPKVDGIEFLGTPGRSEQSSFNMSLGGPAVRRTTVIYTFAVRPTRPDGEVRIPAFTVETDRGALTVAPAGFRLAAATVGQSGVSLDQIATARFVPPAAPVWAGEVFRLGVNLEVDRRYATNSILAAPLEWAPSPFVAEEWSKPSGAETSVNGQPRLLVTMETRATAPATTTASMVSIPSATQLVNLPTGQASPFSLFGQTTFEQFTLTTAPARVAVNPLPQPAPADFIGAVGQFKLVSKVVPEKAAVGEPITWTITLEGTGNWPAIDKLRPRGLGRDFRVVSPRAQKTPKADALFEATFSEDLVLIPQKAGRSTLGPYTISVFNPSAGAYETLRAEPVVIEVTGPAVPPPSANVAPSDATASQPDGDAAQASAELPPEQAAPLPVATLPSDPLAPGLLASAPRPAWPRPLFLAPLALLAPFALWLFLAARHARAHDPLRPRREAHEELRRIIARLESSSGGTPSPASATDLLAWQHAARALFNLPSRTPTARDLPDAGWAGLWTETERALYSPDTRLGKDWFAQAWRLHAGATPPARGLFAALRPAHLFPRVALWAVAISCLLVESPVLVAASDTDTNGVQLYSRGDFPAAEKALRTHLDAAPLDAARHHNLALALSQQGKWDEAAAHAYAAALQVPGDPALDRLFAATAPKAAYLLRLPPSPARVLNARGWQTAALVSAAVLFAVAPGAYLFALYLAHPRRRSPMLVGHATLLIAVAALGASLLALRAHGPAASPDAALVWRAATLRAVPTDVGEQKVTADLPAGTLARVDKDFLGWRRVVLPDGNSGWVRAEALVPLWR